MTSPIEDRLREQLCGCRYDSVTGIFTRFCYPFEAQRALEECTHRSSWQQAEGSVRVCSKCANKAARILRAGHIEARAKAPELIETAKLKASWRDVDKLEADLKLEKRLHDEAKKRLQDLLEKVDEIHSLLWGGDDKCVEQAEEIARVAAGKEKEARS